MLIPFQESGDLESYFRNFMESKTAILPNELNLSTSLLSSPLSSTYIRAVV